MGRQVATAGECSADVQAAISRLRAQADQSMAQLSQPPSSTSLADILAGASQRNQTISQMISAAQQSYQQVSTLQDAPVTSSPELQAALAQYYQTVNGIYERQNQAIADSIERDREAFRQWEQQRAQADLEEAARLEDAYEDAIHERELFRDQAAEDALDAAEADWMAGP
jgi:hypothetical protein